jgi:hypothetical protein
VTNDSILAFILCIGLMSSFSYQFLLLPRAILRRTCLVWLFAEMDSYGRVGGVCRMCAVWVSGQSALCCLCCSKIAEAEAAMSVNEKKWLVMHVQSVLVDKVHCAVCVSGQVHDLLPCCNRLQHCRVGVGRNFSLSVLIDIS